MRAILRLIEQFGDKCLTVYLTATVYGSSFRLPKRSMKRGDDAAAPAHNRHYQPTFADGQCNIESGFGIQVQDLARFRPKVLVGM
jgi:hypothetical protein